MEFLIAWALIASVQLAATMSPGPAFVVSVRNALSYGRSVGIWTSLGLGLGVGAHIVFVMTGLSFLIAQSTFLYMVIKYVGAVYLFYMGVKGLFFSKKDKSIGVLPLDQKAFRFLSVWGAVKMGFLTNLLNPKAVVFFTAIYAQFIDVSTPFSVQLIYGGTSIMIEFLWFVGVTLVLTQETVRRLFMNFVHWINRLCGGLMIALGLKLALSR